MTELIIDEQILSSESRNVAPTVAVLTAVSVMAVSTTSAPDVTRPVPEPPDPVPPRPPDPVPPRPPGPDPEPPLPQPAGPSS